jgi:hypothetical protein
MRTYSTGLQAEERRYSSGADQFDCLRLSVSGDAVIALPPCRSPGQWDSFGARPVLGWADGNMAIFLVAHDIKGLTAPYLTSGLLA